MKRNGMCPICYIKKAFSRPSKITDLHDEPEYNPEASLTPPMGWSSWNTFRNNIDEDLILDTAVAMKEKGLIDAGYHYINLDDCWQSSLRDNNGELQGDLTTFSRGIPDLVKRVNALGLKVGIYSSNGTETCEDLPASLNNEYKDALTFARWGIEYFKYDFCHNIRVSKYAPLVYGITIAPVRQKESVFYPCSDAHLFGLARFMRDKRLPGGKYVSGLDANHGAMEYDAITVPEDGEYVLTVNVRKKGQYSKCLMLIVNDLDSYVLDIPPQKHYNVTARFQTVVKLNAGTNKVRLFNPVETKADSEMLQYRKMGKALLKATKTVAEETNSPEKPITFSICEWGWGKPWVWGKTAGNLWRTTPDIRPIWHYLVGWMYESNVKKYLSAGVGHWNDPDMLEVGNGKLTYNENVAHFSLWCMMASPLILGNDLRNVSDEVLSIITNKDLIDIDQDPLGKQAKRIVKGSVDVLARPLFDGSVAVCIFNKSCVTKHYKLELDKLCHDKYVNLRSKNIYSIKELWSGETDENHLITAVLPKHSVKVYKIK